MRVSVARLWMAAAVALAGATSCAVPPSEECVQFLDCLAHFDDTYDTGGTQGLDAYGEGGSCWRSVQNADACTQACASGVRQMADALTDDGNDVGACDPTSL